MSAGSRKFAQQCEIQTQWESRKPETKTETVKRQCALPNMYVRLKAEEAKEAEQRRVEIQAKLKLYMGKCVY